MGLIHLLRSLASEIDAICKAGRNRERREPQAKRNRAFNSQLVHQC